MLPPAPATPTTDDLTPTAPPTTGSEGSTCATGNAAESAEGGAWNGGWLRSAVHAPSPNFGPRPADAAIDLAVVHSISLPPGEYGTGCVQQLFANQLDWEAHPYFQGIRGLEVSSHFFITRAGVVWQFVSCDDRAWHAGRSHWQGRDNCNDFSIGIELEGLEGLHFEPAQYTALTALCTHVAQRYPLAHVAGHEHIAPGRKQDPGTGFDWPQLQRGLAPLGLHWPAAVQPD